MKKKIPITYTGSDTENLYVLGIRNDREIKLKVKEIGCHGPIRVDGVTEDKESYTNESSLKEAAEKGELCNNTIYIINDNGDEKKYIYYNDELVPMGLTDNSEIIPSGGLTIGSSFETFQELKTALNNGSLKSDTIYRVTDKGTIEQYILSKNNLIQIAGGLNHTTEDSGENISSMPVDDDGVIDYNLTELVNGDYMFKNHKELTEIYCDMPNLKSAIQMFYGCPLRVFNGTLGSLENGYEIFKGAALDLNSILYIVDSIKDVSKSSGTHQLYIGYDSTISPSDIDKFKTELMAKGWTTTFEASN